MPEPEDTLARSPVDFDSAVAYALHSEMRRLIILYLVGTLLVPVGLSIMITEDITGIIFVDEIIGALVLLVGATFLFGGLVGALFKVVADGNILAAALEE